MAQMKDDETIMIPLSKKDIVALFKRANINNLKLCEKLMGRISKFLFHTQISTEKSFDIICQSICNYIYSQNDKYYNDFIKNKFKMFKLDNPPRIYYNEIIFRDYIDHNFTIFCSTINNEKVWGYGKNVFKRF